LHKKAAKPDKLDISLQELLRKGDYLRDQMPDDYHEYLALVDWSGRAIIEGKRGSINIGLPPIL
jgi:hypothetical protein